MKILANTGFSPIRTIIKAMLFDVLVSKWHPNSLWRYKTIRADIRKTTLCEDESTRCFRPCIVCFSYICLYHIISSQEIWAPFGHQSFKIIVLLYTSMCKKVSISKVFYSLILFDSKKSNTIFYLR